MLLVQTSLATHSQNLAMEFSGELKTKRDMQSVTQRRKQKQNLKSQKSYKD